MQRFMAGCILGFFLLAGCQGKNENPTLTSEALPTEAILPTVTSEPTFYPEPEAEIIYPGSESYPGSEYPNPGDSLSTDPTLSPDPYLAPDPYLEPTAEQNSVTQSGEEPNPYPDREQEAANTGPTPYPDPGSENTPGEALPEEPVIRTQIVIPTPFPILVQKNILATDPATVKLDSGRIQFIMFFAYWDGISKAMAPVISLLEEEYGDELNFVYLDIDNPATSSLKKTLKYQYQPEYYLIDESGLLLKLWSGFVDEAELRAELSNALSK